MKKWFRFEVLYQKVNPLSFEKKNKILSSYQSAYKSNQKEAEEHAIKCFECEHLGDKLISITLISE
jgi:hypothetical protein